MPDRLFSSSRLPLPWPLREHASSKSLDPHGKWALLQFVPPSWLRSESPAVLRCPQTCLLWGQRIGVFPASLINLHFFLGAHHKDICTFCFHDCKYCGEYREGRRTWYFLLTENVAVIYAFGLRSRALPYLCCLSRFC